MAEKQLHAYLWSWAGENEPQCSKICSLIKLFSVLGQMNRDPRWWKGWRIPCRDGWEWKSPCKSPNPSHQPYGLCCKEIIPLLHCWLCGPVTGNLIPWGRKCRIHLMKTSRHVCSPFCQEQAGWESRAQGSDPRTFTCSLWHSGQCSSPWPCVSWSMYHGEWHGWLPA